MAETLVVEAVVFLALDLFPLALLLVSVTYGGDVRDLDQTSGYYGLGNMIAWLITAVKVLLDLVLPYESDQDATKRTAAGLDFVAPDLDFAANVAVVWYPLGAAVNAFVLHGRIRSGQFRAACCVCQWGSVVLFCIRVLQPFKDKNLLARWFFAFGTMISALPGLMLPFGWGPFDVLRCGANAGIIVSAFFIHSKDRRTTFIFLGGISFLSGVFGIVVIILWSKGKKPWGLFMPRTEQDSPLHVGIAWPQTTQRIMDIGQMSPMVAAVLLLVWSVAIRVKKYFKKQTEAQKANESELGTRV